MYDQRFFNTELLIRDAKQGLVTFQHPDNIFYTDCTDLELELLPAYLHNNDFTKNGFVIPGKFNIGKHIPRRLEAAYKFADKTAIKINADDAMLYVKFNTDEEIKFVKFIVNDEYRYLLRDVLEVREYTSRIHPLSWWYDLVKRNNYKKYFLNIIKKNIL